MKCSECETNSQFVCFCENTKFLCLTHLYYHSELCKRPKKTSEAYISYRNSLKSSLIEVKKQVSKYTKDTIQLIQKSLSKVFKEINQLEKLFKKPDDFESKSFSDHLQKIQNNYLNYTKKVSNIFQTFCLQKKKAKHSKSMSQKIENLSDMFLGMEIDEFIETCQLCQASLLSSESLNISCGQETGCSLCLDCRLLDQNQCISCFRYYSASESMIFPNYKTSNLKN